MKGTTIGLWNAKIFYLNWLIDVMSTFFSNAFIIIILRSKLDEQALMVLSFYNNFPYMKYSLTMNYDAEV